MSPHTVTGHFTGCTLASSCINERHVSHFCVEIIQTDRYDWSLHIAALSVNNTNAYFVKLWILCEVSAQDSGSAVIIRKDLLSTAWRPPVMFVWSSPKSYIGIWRDLVLPTTWPSRHHKGCTAEKAFSILLSYHYMESGLSITASDFTEGSANMSSSSRICANEIVPWTLNSDHDLQAVVPRSDTLLIWSKRRGGSTAYIAAQRLEYMPIERHVIRISICPSLDLVLPDGFHEDWTLTRKIHSCSRLLWQDSRL